MESAADDNIMQFIHHRILEIAGGRNVSFPWEQSIAQGYNVLPVYADLGGALALGRDLEIYAIPDDPHQNSHLEADSVLRNMALLLASRTYAELKPLAPKRPTTAIGCADCKGTGKNPISLAQGFEHIICRCGGLGWLENGSGQ